MIWTECSASEKHIQNSMSIIIVGCGVSEKFAVDIGLNWFCIWVNEELIDLQWDCRRILRCNCCHESVFVIGNFTFFNGLQGMYPLQIADMQTYEHEMSDRNRHITGGIDRAWESDMLTLNVARCCSFG